MSSTTTPTEDGALLDYTDEELGVIGDTEMNDSVSNMEMLDTLPNAFKGRRPSAGKATNVAKPSADSAAVEATNVAETAAHLEAEAEPVVEPVKTGSSKDSATSPQQAHVEDDGAEDMELDDESQKSDVPYRKCLICKRFHRGVCLFKDRAAYNADKKEREKVKKAAKKPKDDAEKLPLPAGAIPPSDATRPPPAPGAMPPPPPPSAAQPGKRKRSEKSRLCDEMPSCGNFHPPGKCLTPVCSKCGLKHSLQKQCPLDMLHTHRAMQRNVPGAAPAPSGPPPSFVDQLLMSDSALSISQNRTSAQNSNSERSAKKPRRG